MAYTDTVPGPDAPGDALRRIRRLSAVLRAATLLIGLALLAGLIAGAADPGIVEGALSAGQAPATAGLPFDAVKHAGILCVWALRVAVLLSVLWAVAALLACYRDGEIFSSRTAALVRRIGLRLLLLSLTLLVTTPLVSVILTYDAAAGERMLAITLDSTMLVGALAGGVMVLIGWVMRVGAALAEDNAAIV